MYKLCNKMFTHKIVLNAVDDAMKKSKISFIYKYISYNIHTLNEAFIWFPNFVTFYKNVLGIINKI